MKKNLLFPLVGVLAFGTSASLSAQDIRTPAQAREHGLESLRTILIREGRPSPDNRGDFIQNNTSAHQLGKALFYDMAVGSDGIQSCATCHFHAGADNRTKNSLSPGLLRVKEDRNGDIMGYADAASDADTRFERGAPNSELTADDFPFVRDIGDAATLVNQGVPIEQLNIGNVHYAEGRRTITPSVHLSQDDMDSLDELDERGVQVTLQTLPGDELLNLEKIHARYEAT